MLHELTTTWQGHIWPLWAVELFTRLCPAFQVWNESSLLATTVDAVYSNSKLTSKTECLKLCTHLREVFIWSNIRKSNTSCRSYCLVILSALPVLSSLPRLWRPWVGRTNLSKTLSTPWAVQRFRSQCYWCRSTVVMISEWSANLARKFVCWKMICSNTPE